MSSQRIQTLFIACLMLLIIRPGNTTDMTFSGFIDLQHTAQKAIEKRLPILVLFSSDDCDNCRIVKEDFLVPMLKSGEYTDKVIIHVIETDNGQTLRDFSGLLQDHAAFANRFSLELTPTVVMLDADGNQLTPAINGLSTVEFYGGFLDEAIAAALAIIR